MDHARVSEISKKLINEPQDCVDENLIGFAACNPCVKKLSDVRVIVRSDIEAFKESGRVALISGGGSGHEPMFAGFVGNGGLTAAVAGSIFASPPPSQILAGLEAINNANGILVLIINYTGDRLNFGIAIERFKQRSKTPIRSLTVADDCALTSRDRSAGRRGLAGTLFVIKICGAMANEGLSLDQICVEAEDMLKNIGTIGVGLSSCSLPNSAPTFKLGSNEMELGLGVHGEPGVKRTSVQTAKGTVQTMLSHMTNSQSPTRLNLTEGDAIAVIFNNLGGLSQIEMGILAKEIIQNMDARSIKIQRIYVGTFMTSLEMRGFSISILTIKDKKWCSYLDSDISCASWPIKSTVKFHADFSIDLSKCIKHVAFKEHKNEDAKKVPNLSSNLGKCLLSVCDVLAQKGEYLDELDRYCGDGDCGTTMKRGFAAIREALVDDKLSVENPAKLLAELSDIFENSTGGTIGALYSLFLSSASKSIFNENLDDYKAWFRALICGTETIEKYGSAKPGDRTMIDPLDAASTFAKNVLKQSKHFESKILQDLSKVVYAAVLSTKDMQASAGRASYVATENLTQPDPGAMGVYLWIQAIIDFLRP